MNTTLEKKIATALTDDVTASAIAALIEETEASISHADAAAERERAKALDPTLSPDAKAAREAMLAAEFGRDRLCTALPRLQRRLQEVQAMEYFARWEPDFEQVEAKVEAASRKYAKYPTLVTELVDIFRDAEEVDKEVARINGSAPSGEHRRLRSVELTARGLDSFTTANPSISRSVQLPDWGPSDRMAWPPPSTPLAVLASQGMAAPPHSGGEWWRGREERAAAQRAEQARVAAYYENMERQREEREAAEAQARRSRR